MLEESMGGLKKHEAVNKAVREAFSRFKSSSKRNCFSWATVVFGLDAAVQMKVTPAVEVDDDASYDPLFPTLVNSSGTCLGIGLNVCKVMAENFLENSIPGIVNKVAIVILSDGMSEITQTRAVAEGLKRNPRIELYGCQFLGCDPSPNQDRGSDLLRSIVSNSERGFTVAHDTETIRGFFISSISTSAGIPKPT